jgi:hypothetical protein
VSSGAGPVVGTGPFSIHPPLGGFFICQVQLQ